MRKLNRRSSSLCYSLGNDACKFTDFHPLNAGTLQARHTHAGTDTFICVYSLPLLVDIRTNPSILSLNLEWTSGSFLHPNSKSKGRIQISVPLVH